MGRYYSGDIEGKFWFACQSSDDADNFGVVGTPPNDTLHYNFGEGDKPKVEKGIALCVLQLEHISKLLPDLLDAYHFSDRGDGSDASTEWKEQSDEPISNSNILAVMKYKSNGVGSGKFEAMLTAYNILVDEDEVNKIHEVYARLILGRKILMSIERTGQCWFEAEL